MINCIKSYELAKQDEDSKLTIRFSNTEIICGLEKNTLVNDGSEGMTGVDSRENGTAVVDSSVISTFKKVCSTEVQKNEAIAVGRSGTKRRFVVFLG